MHNQSYIPLMKKLTRFLTRYWGYLALIVTISGYFGHRLALTVIFALSLAAFGYFLVQAPVWCCAITRKGEMCRENSHGLLLGCWRRQHKWQRVRQTFTPAGGRAMLMAGRSASGFLVLVGGLFAGIQTLVTIGRIVIR